MGGFGGRVVLGRPGLTQSKVSASLGGAAEVFRGNPQPHSSAPTLNHSLTAGESQLPDGALLGGELSLSDRHSCVVPRHTKPGLVHDWWPKEGRTSSRPSSRETFESFYFHCPGALSHRVKPVWVILLEQSHAEKSLQDENKE